MGRASPTRMEASLLWVVTTDGTERMLMSLLLFEVLMRASRPKSRFPFVRVIVPLSIEIPGPLPLNFTTLSPATVRPNASMPRLIVLPSVTSAMSTSMRTCGRTTSICLISSFTRLMSSWLPEATIELLRSSATIVIALLNCDGRSSAFRALSDALRAATIGCWTWDWRLFERLVLSPTVWKVWRMLPCVRRRAASAVLLPCDDCCVVPEMNWLSTEATSVAFA